MPELGKFTSTTFLELQEILPGAKPISCVGPSRVAYKHFRAQEPTKRHCNRSCTNTGENWVAWNQLVGTRCAFLVSLSSCCRKRLSHENISRSCWAGGFASWGLNRWGFGIFERVWSWLARCSSGGPPLHGDVVDEPVLSCTVAPLSSFDLRRAVSGTVTCSDAPVGRVCQQRSHGTGDQDSSRAWEAAPAPLRGRSYSLFCFRRHRWFLPCLGSIGACK